jgi:hypothetical protein
VPDVTVAIPRTPYHGLFMEFKTPGGKLSPLQQMMLTELEAQGYAVAVPRSVEEAKELLLGYLGERDIATNTPITNNTIPTTSNKP